MDQLNVFILFTRLERLLARKVRHRRARVFVQLLVFSTFGRLLQELVLDQSLIYSQVSLLSSDSKNSLTKNRDLNANHWTASFILTITISRASARPS